MDSNELFIKCECHGEGIEITRDDELNQYYLAFWGYGFNNNKKFSFWRRLIFAWMLIIKGTLYNDMVILDDNKATELVDFINKTKKS